MQVLFKTHDVVDISALRVERYTFNDVFGVGLHQPFNENANLNSAVKGLTLNFVDTDHQLGCSLYVYNDVNISQNIEVPIRMVLFSLETTYKLPIYYAGSAKTIKNVIEL